MTGEGGEGGGEEEGNSHSKVGTLWVPQKGAEYYITKCHTRLMNGAKKAFWWLLQSGQLFSLTTSQHKWRKKLKRKRRSSSSCSKKRNQKKPCYMRLWPLLPFDETRREETSINSFAHNNHHSSAWYRDTSIIVWQKYWILLCQNYFCTSKVKRQISGEFDTCKV